MNLLKALKIVFVAGAVCNRPHSEIVHVSHHAPGVFEGQLLVLKKFVIIGCLSRVVCNLRQVSEVLRTRLKNTQFVHFN